jgi:UDP-N-acetylmuramate dehydrogenase
MKIKKNIPLSKFTTFRIGGNADFFSMPENQSDIITSLDFAKQRGLKCFVMGGGANLLISDDGFRGMVISTMKLKKVKIDGVSVLAESGVSVDALNAKLIRHSLSGMEFSSGLPGSLGGSIYMNAKAYGSEFSGITEYVEIINEKLVPEKLFKTELEYAYKSSIFMKRSGIFIYRIALKLNKEDKKEISISCEKNKNDRKIKGQFDYPSAGCIFKNSYDLGIPTGKIIEELGLKGTSIGGAEVFSFHANFIINRNNATATDVVKLIELIEKKVYEEKGIRLEREVQLLGFDS